MAKKLGLVLFFLVSQSAYAHNGDELMHWLTEPEHLLVIGGGIAVMLMATYFLVNHIKERD